MAQLPQESSARRILRSMVRRFSRPALVGLVAIGAFVTGVFVTRAGWLTPFTGAIYLEEDIARAKAASFKTGSEKGQSALEDLYRVAYQGGLYEGRRIGYVDGYEKGKEEAYDEGYSEGYNEGCQNVFETLGTDRVMDFWDYSRGVRYAYYYTDGICDY